MNLNKYKDAWKEVIEIEENENMDEFDASEYSEYMYTGEEEKVKIEDVDV